MEKIETRYPSAGRWVRVITAVAKKAKTGYDWTGAFVDSARLGDEEIGTMLASCSDIGSRKHPCDRVRLRILMPDGTWRELAQAEGKEWAYSLRGVACEWLALPIEARVMRACQERVQSLGAKEQRTPEDEEKLAVTRKWIEDHSTPVATQGIDVDTLLAEREALVKRLAEIQEILAAQTVAIG